MDSTKPKSRRDLFLWIKEYLGQFKKPVQLSLKRTRELFEEDYAYNEKELYVGYEFTAGYILICSETVYDERIYNFVLTELDTQDVISELDFDDKHFLLRFIVGELHLAKV